MRDKPANHLAMAAVLETDYDLVFVSSGAEAIEGALESWRPARGGLRGGLGPGLAAAAR